MFSSKMSTIHASVIMIFFFILFAVLQDNVKADIIWHRDEGFGNKSFCVNGLSYYSTVNKTKSLLTSTLLDGENRELCYFCICTMQGNEYTCLPKNRTYCDYYRWIRTPGVIMDRYKKWHMGYYTPPYSMTLSYRLRRAFDTSMIGFMSDVNKELRNSRCVPFISQYTDCTEDNLCNGCRRCTCDAKGSWSCKDISECGTLEVTGRRSQDIDEEEYVDSRRFDKASKLLGNEIEEIRRSTLYGDENLYLTSKNKPNGYRTQDDADDSERFSSRNKRDSKSPPNDKTINMIKSNFSTKPSGSLLDNSSKVMKKYNKMEDIILKNVTSKSDNTTTRYDNTKKLKEQYNSEKNTTSLPISNKGSTNETLFRRNIRDSKDPDYQNQPNLYIPKTNTSVNLTIKNTKHADLTSIVSRRSMKNNEEELLNNQGNSSSDILIKTHNNSLATEANNNGNVVRGMADNDVDVDLSKLEDLTQLLKMFNEPSPTVKNENGNKMLSTNERSVTESSTKKSEDSKIVSMKTLKLAKDQEQIDKDIYLGSVYSIDRFHDLLSEATKLDPLKYHAQLLEDLVESVVPSDGERKDPSEQVLFKIKDEDLGNVKIDLPQLSKVERNALEHDRSLSPKDRLLITLLARESKTNINPQTMELVSGIGNSFKSENGGNELVEILQRLTNVLESKYENRSESNHHIGNQQAVDMDEILKQFEVGNKKSVYGNAKKILCEQMDGCDINNLKFATPRDKMLDEDNIEELKRHLLRLLADLEKIGGSSKKYKFYESAKVEDVLGELLESANAGKILEEIDSQTKMTRNEIENETDNNIKKLRHAHSLHHKNRTFSGSNKNNVKATIILAKMLKSLNLLKTETSFSSRRKDTNDYLPGDTPYDVSKSVMLWERIIHNLDEKSDTNTQAETRRMNTMPKSYTQNDISSIINNLENDDLILRKSGNSDVNNDPTFKLSILKSQELEMSKYIKVLGDIRDVMDNVELSPKFLKKIENFLADVQYDIDLNKHVINTVSMTPTLNNMKKPRQDIPMFNVFNQLLINDRAISNSMKQVTTTQKTQLLFDTDQDVHSLKAILEKYNIRRHGGFSNPKKYQNRLTFRKEDIYNQIAKNSFSKLSSSSHKTNPNVYSINYNIHEPVSSYVPQISHRIDTGYGLHALDDLEEMIARMCSKIACQSKRRYPTKLDSGTSQYVPQFPRIVGERGNSGMESLTESICSKIPCQPEHYMDTQDTFALPVMIKQQDEKIPHPIPEQPRLLFSLKEGNGLNRIQQRGPNQISRTQIHDLLRAISPSKI